MSTTILNTEMMALITSIVGGGKEITKPVGVNTYIMPIRNMAKKVQTKLGSRHLEGAYKNLLAAYLKKELPECEIETEKKIEIVFDDPEVGKVPIGVRRADIYIKTPAGGITLELKHIVPDPTARYFPGEEQLKFYMRADPDAPKLGMCISFWKEYGYPRGTGEYPEQAGKVQFLEILM